MRPGPLLAAMAVAATACAAVAANVDAGAGHAHIAISAANPLYLAFRGRCVGLVSSSGHYGSLINLGFDYHKYLATLQANNFSHTQIFSGAYVEPDSDCNPKHQNPGGNTLSPANGSFIAPWQRTSTPGGSKGGNKFDLTKYNDTYFERLKDYVRTASAHGIVVQIGLFCGYDAGHEFIWAASPMNPANNVNGLSGVNRSTVYTLDAGAAMTAVQVEMTTRIVQAVKEYDNVIVELVFTAEGTDSRWAARIAEAVRAADGARLLVVPKPWLGTMPFRNGVVTNCGAGANCSSTVDAGVYVPPSTDQPNVLDSAGTSDLAATRAAYWSWALSGGAVVYNLDWSYTVGHEDGSEKNPQVAKTSSGPAFRHLASVLSNFMAGLDLEHVVPSTAWVSAAAPGAKLWALGPRPAAPVARRTLYAVYVSGRVPTLRVCPHQGGGVRTAAAVAAAPELKCGIMWTDPATGRTTAYPSVRQTTPCSDVKPPAYTTDVAMTMTCVATSVVDGSQH